MTAGVGGTFWAVVCGRVLVTALRTRRSRATGLVAIGSAGLVVNRWDEGAKADRMVVLPWAQVAQVGVGVRWHWRFRGAWLLPVPRRFKTVLVTRVRLVPATTAIDPAWLLPEPKLYPFTHGVDLLHGLWVDERSGTPALALANIALWRFAGPRYVPPETVKTETPRAD